jgi:hypothetical protein
VDFCVLSFYYDLHIEDQMFIVPVPFSIEGAKMLYHTKLLLDERQEDGSSFIVIHKEKYHKLVTTLRTVVANEYKLDKEQTSFNDLLTRYVYHINITRGERDNVR